MSWYAGCFLLHPDTDGIYPSGVFGCEELEDSLLDDEPLPDISIDPEDGTLSLINSGVSDQTFFVTISNATEIVDATGLNMLDQNKRLWGLEYVTIIALVSARRVLDVCVINGGESLKSVTIQSDLQIYAWPQIVSDEVFDLAYFPLKRGSNEFLCTQSQGGMLTHFAHPSTFYAVDFQCSVGTPVLVVFDGTVVDIRNETCETGVRVENLFKWNSIMIASSDKKWFAEYVHVQKDSFSVSVGDTVVAGQVLCLSGNSGFCPEPHLHFEVHRDNVAGSQSVPIVWKGESFQPNYRYS